MTSAVPSLLIEASGDGVTRSFHISFGFLQPSHIQAEIDGQATTDFTVSGDTLTFTTAPADGTSITFTRSTPHDELYVKPKKWARLPARDLKAAFNQVLYYTEEVHFAGDS